MIWQMLNVTPLNIQMIQTYICGFNITEKSQTLEGSGVQTLPDLKIVNNGCFLCRENISWQQKNTQVGLVVTLADDIYYALMNPFPLMPNHLVVADDAHISQEWEVIEGENGRRGLFRLLTDLCKTATLLPNHVGFYNGVGAGASIPTHLHFQFFVAWLTTLSFLGKPSV